MAPPSAAAGADEAAGRARPQASAASEASARDPLWDFYACALEPDEGEDTEDELETQDWIRFERRRAQQRLAEACRREARLGLARAHK